MSFNVFPPLVCLIFVETEILTQWDYLVLFVDIFMLAICQCIDEYISFIFNSQMLLFVTFRKSTISRL